MFQENSTKRQKQVLNILEILRVPGCSSGSDEARNNWIFLPLLLLMLLLSACFLVPWLLPESSTIFFSEKVFVNFRVIALNPADLTPVNGGLTIYVKVRGACILHHYKPTNKY